MERPFYLRRENGSWERREDGSEPAWRGGLCIPRGWGLVLESGAAQLLFRFGGSQRKGMGSSWRMRGR